MNEFFTKLIQKIKTQPLLYAGGFLIVCALAFIMALGILGNNKDFAVKDFRVIEVKPGMTTADIAVLLHEKQLVKHPDAFKLEARFKGLEKKLQAGSYKIDGGLSNSEIVNVLAEGSILYVNFTVPEGYNVIKTAKKLEEQGLGKADKFIAAAKDYAPYAYMQTDDSNVVFKAEGFIYPATYEIPLGASEEQILELMVKQFDTEMENAGILKTVSEQGLNLRDIVNIAAMVELEAVFAEEQPRIAGVFLKRLQIGMPIQSDTTIQYILGAQKEVITFKDTEIQNPYNTYQNMGLPPGPIASPSLAAIKAVLAPEETNYLYFVAEKDGHHRFTATYDEHLQAINEIHGE